MLRYIVRRLLWVVVVVLLITLLTFVIFFVMPSTDPARAFCGKQCTQATYLEVKKEFGLDRPWFMQYGLFVKHIFLGDQWGWPGLGKDFDTRSPLKSLLVGKLIVTVELALGAGLVWLLIGIPIGVLSALRPRSLFDRIAMGFALFGVSAPVFWLGLMFLYVFWFKLHIAAGTGYYAFAHYGFFTWINHMIMPWVVLALLYAAFYARMSRGNLIETLSEDYIRTARAKGLSERRVIARHALRSSLTPVITMFGMDLGSLLGGAIITETVFNLPGIGAFAVSSVFQGDLYAIVDVTLIAAFFVTIMNVIVDVIYAYLDPRVRYA